MQEIGIGGTSAWKMSGIDSGLTLAIFFEVANQVTRYILIFNYVILLRHNIIIGCSTKLGPCLELQGRRLGRKQFGYHSLRLYLALYHVPLRAPHCHGP